MLFHLFQAKLAGCWKGVQIHGVKLVLLNHIIMRFDKELAKLTAEVFLYSFNYYRLLNSYQVEERKKELAELNRNLVLLQHYQAPSSRINSHVLILMITNIKSKLFAD